MKKKGKISHVKRTNQLHTRLSKQGKLKKQRNKRKLLTKTSIEAAATNQVYSDEEESMPIIKKNDITFLKKSVANKSYDFLDDMNLSCPDPLIKKRRRKAADVEDSTYEDKYEIVAEQQPAVKKQKMLLPIKTSQGIVARMEDILDNDPEKEETTDVFAKQLPVDDVQEALEKFTKKKEISSAELLATRQETLAKKKFRIGILSAGLLEAPEAKIENFKDLLLFLEENDPRVRITVRKIALISLLEVFKDLLPSYQIKHHDDPKVKLKKGVKELHGYESNLLQVYKTFLQKVEKIIYALRKKKGDQRVFDEAELKLAELGVSCLCELLETHPYFNFSKNIIHLLVPFLNVKKEGVRNIVSKCFRTIFKTDTRGEVSLEIVRFINKVVKGKNCCVHPAMLDVFLALKLKDVNLDKEKEAEIKKKKLLSKKQNVLRLSKRERKREKHLKELNKELLETKAEENKQSKMHHLTEITSLVFALYFKVLKSAPSSRLLKVTLEGIAKFAHCINVDFYHDLINVLDELILNEELGQKEQLCCVQTVFTILNYEGATINVDPVRFYNHFYSIMLSITSGKNHSDLGMIVNAAESVVIRKRKHISLQRLLAFLKRLSTLSLQVLPNGSLALLSLIKQVLQGCKASGVLLDTDSSFGHGVYQPELEQPEYCNAAASALWELLPLQRHYHPTVREYAKYIASLSDPSKDQVPSGKTFVKRSSLELLKEYDFSDVRFVPAVPPPSSIPKKKNKQGSNGICNSQLKDYIKQVISKKKDVK